MKSIIPQYYKSSKRIQKNAKVLRRKQTPAEERLWKMIRNRNLSGLKFRRQHPISRFIADFYCDELKLVIEIDGDIHDLKEVKENDLKRENQLKELGLRIIRFTNEDVFNNPHVIEMEVRKIFEENG